MNEQELEMRNLLLRASSLLRFSRSTEEGTVKEAEWSLDMWEWQKQYGRLMREVYAPERSGS